MRAAVTAAAVCASVGRPTAGADPTSRLTSPDPFASLRDGLMTALGPSFEFVGGNVGRFDVTVDGWPTERVWLAAVRATAAGDFAVAYRVRERGTLGAGTRPVDRTATHRIAFRVAPRGTPRLALPDGGYYGGTSPLADVDDVLVLPVLIGEHLSGHAFARVPVPFLFDEATRDDHPLNDAVGDDTGGFLRSIGGRQRMSADVRGNVRHYSLVALATFARPGRATLRGRLSEAGGPASGFAPLSLQLDVVPAGQPVTVAVEKIDLTVEGPDHGTPYRSETDYHLRSREPLQVRVGDRVEIGCGELVGTSGRFEPEPRLTGVLTTRPASNGHGPVTTGPFGGGGGFGRPGRGGR